MTQYYIFYIINHNNFSLALNELTSVQVDGENCTVEIDEAKIGKRKCNKGRIIEGRWIFGGFERNTKKLFIEPVPNWSAETLFEIIKEWIKPGTTIILDCWKSYKCLENENYKHLTVNHQYNFVDLESNAHTQNIEHGKILVVQYPGLVHERNIIQDI